MNRLLLGILLGVAFGIVDVLMTIRHPGVDREGLLAAFFSRFALGIFAANNTFKMDPILAGVLVGILVSLPDAFLLKAYGGIIGTGILFGAISGWIVKMWAR